MIAPKAIIKNGKVINHQQLERYYRDKHERDYLIQRGIFRDLREAQWELEAEKKPQELRPIINITYKVNARSTPAFKDLQEQITELRGKLTKYFESRPKRQSKYS